MCISGMVFKKEDSYNDLVDKALRLWRQYSEIYQTLPSLYAAKLKEAQAIAKNESLAPLKNRDLKAYPDIEFLKKTSEEEAEDYLMDLTEGSLILLIEEIESMPKTNAGYKGMKSKISDYDFIIKKKKKK